MYASAVYWRGDRMGRYLNSQSFSILTSTLILYSGSKPTLDLVSRSHYYLAQRAPLPSQARRYPVLTLASLWWAKIRNIASRSADFLLLWETAFVISECKCVSKYRLVCESMPQFTVEYVRARDLANPRLALIGLNLWISPGRFFHFIV